jgi:hypothetical protein
MTEATAPHDWHAAQVLYESEAALRLVDQELFALRDHADDLTRSDAPVHDVERVLERARQRLQELVQYLRVARPRCDTPEAAQLLDGVDSRVHAVLQLIVAGDPDAHAIRSN